MTSGLVSLNLSTFDGGGLDQIGGTAMVNDSAIVSNAASNGGGIMLTGGVLTPANSTVSGNTAGNDGAGIYNHSANDIVDLANVTIAYNLAGQLFHVGGLKNDLNGTVAVQNTLFAWNAYQGIIIPVESDCDGALTLGGYNLVRVDCAFTHQTGDQVGTFGAPLDPVIGALAYNGGATPTHALLPGSPAIDAGNPGGCLDPQGAALTTDQRGFHRPAFGGKSYRCDMALMNFSSRSFCHWYSNSGSSAC